MDADLALTLYLHLALLSHQKGQWLPRNKFLILAGNAACHAGLLAIAETCRNLIVEHSRAHMLGKYESFPAALKSADFQTYLRQLAKFCSVERAEMLLEGLGQSTVPESPETLNQWLSGME